MPAQLGGEILLQYGTQGAQQVGSAVLLSYDPIVVDGAVLVASATRAPWDTSRPAMRALSSVHSATSSADVGGAMPWNSAAPLKSEDTAAWNRITSVDDGNSSPWGKFDATMDEDRSSAWKGSARTDDVRDSPWGRYGDMLNEDHGSAWKASKPADTVKAGGWNGHFLPVYRPIPYAPPEQYSCDFVVAGGNPLVVQISPAPYSPSLPLAAQLGALGYVPTYLGDHSKESLPPPGNQANFRTAVPRYELVLDGSGNPLIAPSIRHSERIAPWGAAKSIDDTTIIPWLRFSRPLNPGWGVVTPGGPPVPEPGETITIPVQRVYIVVNEILLARVDDNTPIHASQLSIAFDCDSWLPTFSATIPETSRDAVMPDPNPVEVYAYINGSEFKFFVEKIARSRQFAQRSVNISGRGIACELDAPFATASQHTNVSSMTAQQIIDAALEFTTYTQTWNITDWLVPAGTFSLYGTPAQVAGSVAEASGAVLAADWALRDLRMIPRYPFKPWEWGAATPDYVIPAAIAQTESVEWLEKPAYNVVYVSGVQEGVIGQVKITGSAGDKPAPMVTHQLITHADAARQRGISILSDTGRKALMQISLPVLESTGVIDVCKLVEFSDGANTRRGIVRANQVSVNWPTVRQTLTIEAAA